MKSKLRRDPVECNTCALYHTETCPLRAYREECFVLYLGEYHASSEFVLPPLGAIVRSDGGKKVRWK